MFDSAKFKSVFIAFSVLDYAVDELEESWDSGDPV